MTHGRRDVFRGLLFREWVVQKSWLICLTIICAAGPLLNWIQALTDGRAPVRISAAFRSLYNGQSVGALDVSHHHLVGVTYFAAKPWVVVHGAPTVSLWVIAVAMTFGALVTGLDKHSDSTLDIAQMPVRRVDWVNSKFALGLVALVVMVMVRTVFVGLCDITSPWVVPLATVGLSFAVNLAAAWICFAVTCFTGTAVGHPITAWGAGFLLLTLPLFVGALVGFYGASHTSLGTWAYHVEHQILLNLSPFSLTDYTTNMSQTFAQPIKPPDLKPLGTTVQTAVVHPWRVVVGCILATGVFYGLSAWVVRVTAVEHWADIFVSPAAFQVAAVVVSVEFGSFLAQILGRHAQSVSWAIAAVVCYLVLVVVYRRISGVRLRVQAS